MLKDKVALASYKLKHSQLPAQRIKQGAYRLLLPLKVSNTMMKRRLHLKRYGITHDDYNHMLEQQGGSCKACQSLYPGNGKSHYFDVDHCHTSGKVRGLLCRKCNVTLGTLERQRDRITLLETYLTHVEFDPQPSKG